MKRLPVNEKVFSWTEDSRPSGTTASITVPSGLVQQRTRGPGDLPPTLLQRVILPRKADPLAVRALYVDEQHATNLRVRPSSNAATGRRRSDRVREMTFTVPNARRVRVLSRAGVCVPEQAEV